MKLLIQTNRENSAIWTDHTDTILIDLSAGQIIYIDNSGRGSMGYDTMDDFPDAEKLLNESMKEYVIVEEPQILSRVEMMPHGPLVTTNNLPEAVNLKAVGFSEEFITKILKM